MPQLDTFSSALERYSDWGWLVLRSENRLLLTTDHQVSAVELGAGIGGEVQHYLSVRMLGGPGRGVAGISWAMAHPHDVRRRGLAGEPDPAAGAGRV